MATPLERWVEEQARLAKPDRIHWCDGSEEEARKLIEIGMKEEKIGETPDLPGAEPQDLAQLPICHRSHPTDVARTEHLTFVCHPDKDQAGPNNNWMAPAEAKEKLTKLTDGCMKRQDHVRAALHDGPPGFALRQELRPDHRRRPTSP